MSEEDAASDPDAGREDAETAGSGRLEDPPGTADGSGHDADSSNLPEAAVESAPGTAAASTDGPRADTADTRAPRARSTSSTRKRDKKKKGRGAADGEPAMSVEDLFVTISTVQVCMLCWSMYRG